MIFESIKKLVCYGLETGLIAHADKVWATNRILEALGLEEYEEPTADYKNLSSQAKIYATGFVNLK